MRVCVFGNSHVGSLRRAWERNKQKYAEIELTFFASPGKDLQGLKVSNGNLIADSESLKDVLIYTSGTDGDVIVKDYDCFLIYAAQTKSFRLSRDRFYSEAVMSDSIKDVVEGTLSYRILKQIREVSDRFVFFGHTPLVASEKKDEDQSLEAYKNGIALLNERFYSKHQAELLMQSEKTIVNGKNTRKEFTKNSKKLEMGKNVNRGLHEEGDIRHMNDVFGRLWLEAFLPRLAKL